MQQSLFDQKGLSQPLADRLRPQTLEDYVGQEHLLGPGKVLRQMIEQDEVPSMIFWGPPGVGKTTLARTILGFVPDYTGTVTHFTKRPQMVFQDPASSLNPSRTVGWILAEPLRIYGKYGKEEIARRVERTMELVGLDPECRDRLPHQLSGGQRQRVCIGAALIVHPQLIVADEAVSALDVTIQAQILQLMKKLCREQGTSIILITHNMGVVAEICDYVYVMYAGKVMEQAETFELFEHTEHPYTAGLLKSIPRLDEKVDRLYTIEGVVPNLLHLPAGCNFCTRCKEASERCFMEKPCLYQTRDGHGVRCFKYESEVQLDGR